MRIGAFIFSMMFAFFAIAYYIGRHDGVEWVLAVGAATGWLGWALGL